MITVTSLYTDRSATIAPAEFLPLMGTWFRAPSPETLNALTALNRMIQAPTLGPETAELASLLGLHVGRE